MHMILLFLGACIVAAGGAAIVFGIPNYAFGLGNTLILSGTIAVVGGLLLVGTGSVISHLRRIREAVETQKLLRSAGDMDAGAALERTAAGTRGPAAEAIARDAGASAKADGSPAKMPPDAEGRGGARHSDMDGGVSTSPAAIPTAVTAPDTAEPSGFSPGPRPAWPRVDPSDRVASLQSGSAAAAPDAESKGQPDEWTHSDAGSPTLGAVAQEASAAPPPTILKSGVIEGMAYTLYSDGSIEAELAQGTMRFTSIPELRAYLREKAG